MQQITTTVSVGHGIPAAFVMLTFRGSGADVQ